MAKFSASVSINAKSNLSGVTKDIDKGLKKNNASLKKNGEQWKKNAKLMKNMGKVALAGTAAMSAGIIALVKNTADFGDDLAKTAEKTGILVEEIQRLRFSASLGGASMRDLDTGVRVFSKAMDEANQGTAEYKDLFDRLEVSVSNADGTLRKQVDVIGDVSDAFSNAEDDAAKSSIAQQLFGRGGAALIPMLNKGSEALKDQGDELERLGFIMNLEQAKASEQFNDDLLRMRTEIVALGRSIAVDAIPIMNDFINQIRNGLVPFREWVSENIDLAGFLEKIAAATKEIDLKELFDVSLENVKGVISDLGFILKEIRSVIEFWNGSALSGGGNVEFENLGQGRERIVLPESNTTTQKVQISFDQLPAPIQSVEFSGGGDVSIEGEMIPIYR